MSLAEWLVAGLIGLPLLAAVLLVVGRRHASAGAVHRVRLTVVGLTACAALALLPHAGGNRAIVGEWLPGTGPMALGIGSTAVYAVLVTVWSAFLALLACRWEEKHSPWHPSLSGVVLLVALAAANVAFLAEHFLARYVALEIVALCIGLSPLMEMVGPEGTRAAWTSYLPLRLGDAGLLVAILMLMESSGTLEIGPALSYAAGDALSSRQGWIVGGLILAVWVKLGGLPFHLWVRAGRRLSLSSRTWLFGTVMPNLGLYLLYRVSPLVALPGPARTVAMWLGAAGAALAALLALVQTDVRAAPAYLGAVQAGLVVFVAAGWGKEAVWLALLVLTPLRTLLFVAADTPGDKVSAGMLSLGGLALAGFGATLVWWGRAGGSAGALFVAEAAVGLVAAWAVQVTWRFMVEPWDVSRPGQVHGTRLVVLALLGAVILAGGLAFEPLAHRLAAATGQSSPVIPALPSLLEHMAVMPVALTVVVLVAALWGLQRRFKRPAFDEGSGDAYNLEEALTHAAEALRNVVEVSLLEHGLVLALRAVLGSARAAHRFVEQQGLERGLDLALRAVLGSARAALRFVEQQGLEGALRWFGHTVLRMSRAMQRWHNGRLRRYLLWIPITLALALLALWWPE